MAAPQRKVRALRTSQVTITDLLPSWQRSLEARNLAPLSIMGYSKRLARFLRWLAAEERGDVVSEVTKADIERYLADSLRNGAAPKSVSDYHGALLVFFRWCEDEGEVTRSPMRGVRAPIVTVQPPSLLRDEDLADLLRTCEGPGDKGFMARRDAAILRMLIDCGVRLSELAGMTLASLNLTTYEVTVLGNGRKMRTVAFHSRTAQALDRYLRIRQRHVCAHHDALWLGSKGDLTDDGIYQVVKRRAQQAGIPARVWPHLLRHGWAHQWLKEGGQEHALAKMAGWSNTQMAGRYGAALAEERARDEAKRMKGGDRL